MRDPYEVLDIPRSATRVEIKKSFRRLAKELHPDVNKNGVTVGTCFAELNTAYDILGDAKKRRAFDRGVIDAEGRPVRREISLIRTRRPAVKALVMVLMLAVISTLIIRDFTLQRKINSNGDGRDGSLPRSGVMEERAGAQAVEQADRGSPSESRLILQQADLHASENTIPLGLQVTGDAAGLALEITGLPTGTTLTAGRLLGTGRWRILAADVANTLVNPPAGFSGTLEFTVELRLADDTIVDSRQMRLQLPSKPLPNASAGELPLSPASANNVMTLSPSTERDATDRAKALPADRDQIELLIERSQELISEGDAAKARRLLQPAAEAGDARAALALGATYDPIMLTMLRARDVAADVTLAREWYKKAGELGSSEAQERFKLLASTAVGDAEVAEKNTAPPRASMRPRRPMIRSTNRVPVTPGDPNGVYVAGERVGADPDPNIRSQLIRDDAGRELRTDVFGRQRPAEPAPPPPDAR
jgi:hypothetical protein